MPQSERAAPRNRKGGDRRNVHERQGLTLRPASRADLVAYFGEDKYPTVKALAGVLDGDIVGVAGLASRAGIIVAFCDVRPEARAFRITIGRAAQRFMAEAAKRHKFIFAEADENEPGARRWLQSLGFEQIDGALYRWQAR